MRVYVRHPSEFPIELRREGESTARERLRDVSTGGLCCRSSSELVPGEVVRIHIPVGTPGFDVEGRVAWCRQDEQGYRVGIEFTSEVEAFRARMVEQVCHIERYHRQLLESGRAATEEEAGAEWIAKFAQHFPR
jgi:PilZ domain